MFKLDDIVALAKAGYKVSDIKELIELSKSSEGSESGPASKQTEEQQTHLVQSQTDNQKEEILIDNSSESGAELSNEKVPEEEKIIDYKKKTEELEAKIEALQKANTRQNIADEEKSDIDVFAEAMKSFM